VTLVKTGSWDSWLRCSLLLADLLVTTPVSTPKTSMIYNNTRNALDYFLIYSSKAALSLISFCSYRNKSPSTILPSCVSTVTYSVWGKVGRIHEVDRVTCCRDNGHLKIFKMAAGRHLGFDPTGSSVIRFADIENPALPNFFLPMMLLFYRPTARHHCFRLTAIAGHNVARAVQRTITEASQTAPSTMPRCTRKYMYTRVSMKIYLDMQWWTSSLTDCSSDWYKVPLQSPVNRLQADSTYPVMRWWFW